MIPYFFLENSIPGSILLRGGGRGLAKFRASQAPIIQTALYTDLFPCARLCAKHTHAGTTRPPALVQG